MFDREKILLRRRKLSLHDVFSILRGKGTYQTKLRLRFCIIQRIQKPKINVRVHCRHSITVETHPLEKGLSSPRVLLRLLTKEKVSLSDNFKMRFSDCMRKSVGEILKNCDAIYRDCLTKLGRMRQEIMNSFAKGVWCVIRNSEA